MENGREAIQCIQDNLVFTKFANQATLLKQDVFSALNLINETEIDIIFMDPPYGADYEEQLFQLLDRQRYVTQNTLLILEAELNKKADFLEQTQFRVVREKCYKTNKHIFIKRK